MTDIAEAPAEVTGTPQGNASVIAGVAITLTVVAEITGDERLMQLAEMLHSNGGVWGPSGPPGQQGPPQAPPQQPMGPMNGA